MEGKTFSGKSKDSVQFEVKFSKATYYKTGKTVDYVIVIEEDTPYHQYHPYALFVLHENCQSFYTPGVNNKEQVEIDVNDDNKSITIIARGLEIEQSENVIFNNLPTKFVVNIDIQKRVNLKERANVIMENGVTTVQFKMLNNKRKIQIA
ncbi:16033_t:CDS:2 [Funneliformis caledonium]|uniref:16033_t:CDS:1 n=1 Tax=Funneliformis caledonium TaxID=1117310 RepID=A0A9N9BT93_9GLOM|nr:16033_t:CDS:2 [Funneliformis caledonium]